MLFRQSYLIAKKVFYLSWQRMILMTLASSYGGFNGKRCRFCARNPDSFKEFEFDESDLRTYADDKTEKHDYPFRSIHLDRYNAFLADAFVYKSLF